MKTYSTLMIRQKETKIAKTAGRGRFLVPFVAFCAFLVLLLAAGTASAATRYVWQGSPSPAPPYDSWATAAHANTNRVLRAVTP